MRFSPKFITRSKAIGVLASSIRLVLLAVGHGGDLAAEVEDDATRCQTHACLKVVSRHHRHFLRYVISSTVWWSGFPETRISSTMFLIRNRPQPRGVCIPSSLASRSGLCALGFGGGLPPRSMMRTKRRSSRSHTSILTGTSGLYLLPCSMAFIVASATAVLSLCRGLSGNPSALTALATCSIARRSLPGSLGKLSSASIRRAPLVGDVTVPPIFPKVTRVMSSSCSQPSPVKE